MTRLKAPLLSLEAHGTIGDTITFRRRGGITIAERKPIPTDPETTAQLTQRGAFKDAVAAWHALTEEEQAEYRALGKKVGLTGYQYFVQEYLTAPPAPPPEPIDIGMPAEDRATGFFFGDYAFIELDNPANASGKITEVKVYIGPQNYPAVASIIGTCYDAGGGTYTVRDYQDVGMLDHGLNTKAVDIDVEAGDFICISGGHPLLLSADSEGAVNGILRKTPVTIPFTDEGDWAALATWILSLSGTGSTGNPHSPRWGLPPGPPPWEPPGPPPGVPP